MVGRDPLDHKIWRIAWPAILSSISIPLLGLVDAGILGHLPDSRHLGAVAIGSALLVWYLSQPWGNHGLWLPFTLFNAARGLTLYACYRRRLRRDGWFRDR